MKPKQSAGSERGVSALEFTIIAPFLLVLVFGLIEFGCLFYDKAMITNASREGARAGIVFFPDDSETGKPTFAGITSRATAAVNAYLHNGTNLNLIYFGSKNEPNIVIPPLTPGTNGSNKKLSVEVQWRYNFLVLPNFKNLGWVDLDPGIDLNAVSVMMLEQNPE